MDASSLNFTAIDFETANRERCSPCAVGLAKVESGKVVKSISLLINPECDFEAMNISVHGIQPEDVKNAPTFLEAMRDVHDDFIADVSFLVSHSSFDKSVWLQTWACTDQFPPEIEFKCSCQAAKKIWSLKKASLDKVCELLSIPLVHHEPESDAIAAAEVFIQAVLAGYDYTIPNKNEASRKRRLDRLNGYTPQDSRLQKCYNLSSRLFDLLESSWRKDDFNYQTIEQALMLCEAIQTSSISDIFKRDLPPKHKRKSGKLTGICFTGFLKGVRDELEDAARSMGFDPKKGVSSSVGFLVTGPNAGWSKVQKAQKLEIPIFTLDEFDEYLDSMNEQENL